MKRNYDLLTVLALGVLSEIGCSIPAACSVSAARLNQLAVLIYVRVIFNS
jgi:hypothetical protein